MLVMINLPIVLAGLPPETGLYTTIIPSIIQAFFSSYPFNPLGPSAVFCLMVGNSLLTCLGALEEVYPEIRADFNSADPWVQYPAIFDLNSLLTFSVGIILAIVTLFNFGRFFDPLIPKNLIAGFTVAAALSVVVSQLKGLFGIKLPTITGTFTIYKSIYAIIDSRATFNLASFMVGMGTIFLIQLQERIEQYIQKNAHWIKHRISYMFGRENDEMLDIDTTKKKEGAFPKVLASVSIVTCIAYFADLKKTFGVSVIGNIESGLPKLQYPWSIFTKIPSKFHWTVISTLVPNFLAIILVTYCTLKSILQAFPYIENSEVSNPSNENITLPENINDTLIARTSSEISIERGEMTTLSISAIACSVFSGFIPATSLSRSAILATQTSASSPLGNTFSGLIIICAVAFLTKIIAQIPRACLSGVVIYALKSTVQKIVVGYEVLKRSIRSKRRDEFEAAFQWIVTFVSVLIFDPSIGLITAILLNLLLKLFLKINNVVF
jgi:MFS superfamily sulfate permease-like transporter